MSDKRWKIFIVFQSGMMGLLVLWLIIRLGGSNDLQPIKVYRELGSQLQAAGLVHQAAEYYEKYIHASNAPAAQRAKVAFSLGELLESQGMDEKALSYFYMVELLDPDSSYKPQSSKKIVSLLEKTGKVSAAKRALTNATTLNDKSKKSQESSEVIAQIGNKNIYLHDLDKVLDELPSELAQQFQSKERKMDLLKNLLAEEILSQKGVRLGMDQTPDYQNKMAQLQKRILIDMVLEKELHVTVDEVDLKNYFEANRNKYVKKDRPKPEYSQARKEVELDYRKEKMQAQYQMILEKALAGEEVKIFQERIQ